jgi:hypothetical protein
VYCVTIVGVVPKIKTAALRVFETKKKKGKQFVFATSNN